MIRDLFVHTDLPYNRKGVLFRKTVLFGFLLIAFAFTIQDQLIVLVACFVRDNYRIILCSSAPKSLKIECDGLPSAQIVHIVHLLLARCLVADYIDSAEHQTLRLRCCWMPQGLPFEISWEIAHNSVVT